MPLTAEQRVALRAVGRTPEEHAALEAALARRRARRVTRHSPPIRSQNQPHRGPPGLYIAAEHLHSPTPSPPLLSRANAQTTRPNRSGKTVNHSREFLQIMQETEKYRKKSLRRDPSPKYRHYRDIDSPDDYDDEQRRLWWPDSMPDFIEEGEKYERAETNQELIDVRAAIRERTDLSMLCRRVLLLVTQIPEGQFTTYRAIQEHLCEVEGIRSVTQVRQVLRKNPFPSIHGGAVPCHRVIDRSGPFDHDMAIGLHSQDPGSCERLLFSEGTSINPRASTFRGFAGCPKL
ncbi:hypothetical protein F5Y18DRAFT_92849 [Xylariaceae sp. FL1019]|nr:hypothetical protein F5Y18DRAFT_92849 [Xylariaceae sp. FL1019]